MTLRDSVDGLDGVLDGNYAELLIADVRLPPTYRDEGLVAALAARRRYPGLRVLVLSSFVQVEYAAELLADPQGGVGYLLKDRIGEVDDFLSAVGRVMSGETAIDPEVVAALIGRSPAHPLANLTRRESEVLALVGEGLTNREIAERLVITESAVNKHVGAIFVKLGLTAEVRGHRRVRAVLLFLASR